MLNPIPIGRGHFDPSARGYHAVYREGQVNHCPACGRSHWIIGRQLAECAFCTTALPLAEGHAHGSHATVTIRGPSLYPVLDAA